MYVEVQTSCLFFGKSFALKCKTNCLFNVKKSKVFSQAKTLVVAKFCTVFVLYLDAKQVTVSSAKSLLKIVVKK